MRTGIRAYSRLFFPFLLLAIFALLISACPLYNPAAFIQHQTSSSQQAAGADDILSTATQVTLQWDPPASGTSQVASYAISYRTHGTSAWSPLATVPRVLSHRTWFFGPRLAPGASISRWPP